MNAQTFRDIEQKALKKLLFSQNPVKVFRGSHSHMFFKIGVLKNFENFRGKQLCWSLF